MWAAPRADMHERRTPRRPRSRVLAHVPSGTEESKAVRWPPPPPPRPRSGEAAAQSAVPARSGEPAGSPLLLQPPWGGGAKAGEALAPPRRSGVRSHPGLLFRCASRDSLFFLPLLFRYGDMRRQIGFEIRDMWYNLGEYLRLRATGSGVGPVRQRRGT